MTHSGEPFGERPVACPFIALELDRDRRSDKPDYRHRCYAEPTPQPRAIAHQQAYCLSADFTACPIFQGWALRAAARPVPVPAGYTGRDAGSAGAAAGGVVGAAAAHSPVQPPDQPPLPADLPPVVPAPGEPWPSEAFAPVEPGDAPRQLAAFDADLPGGASGGAGEPEEAGVDSLPNPPPDGPDEPPVPGFLAGRTEREPLRPRAVRPDVPFREKVTREDLVPSWDLTNRYGASVKEDGGGGGGDRFGGVITAIAVIAILALGVAGVIFLPGLLSGGHPATPTPPVIASPSLPPFASPTLAPGATQTPSQSVAPSAAPSTTPGPAATPRLYRIKPGDQLYKIAKRYHVSVADILAANPEITDPNHIVVGQVIVIPFPAATATATP
jgi:LysM repeat protein